jgi:SagB-type dehydrogenase family enzyme
MHVMEAIKKRRSIRKYKKVAVEWDKVVAVLEAGRYAPTAGNLQSWKFIVVSEEELKRKVSEACLNQHWIAEAPMIIVVCANPPKVVQHYGDRGEKLYMIQDCAAAVENMLLTATDQGLASCWIGAFDDDLLINVLGIPERAKAMAVVVLGYADEEVPEPFKTPLESLVFLQKYGNRIKNINIVLWDWSLEMEKYAKAGKEKAKKGLIKVAEAVKEKAKKHGKKIKERMKKK